MGPDLMEKSWANDEFDKKEIKELFGLVPEIVACDYSIQANC
jgi:hypothetical protein